MHAAADLLHPWGSALLPVPRRSETAIGKKGIRLPNKAHIRDYQGPFEAGCNEQNPEKTSPLILSAWAPVS